MRGEGEHTFFELVDPWSENKRVPKVPGLTHLDADGNVASFGEETPRIRKFDEIPLPNWPKRYLEKFWSAGKAHGLLTGRDMPIIFSRGCPYSCTFCSNVQMYTNRYVMKNIDDPILEIKNYVERYNVSGLQAYDLTAIVKK